MLYINDLADGLWYNAKLFTDDTSLFSVVHDVDTSANELNIDWGIKSINGLSNGRCVLNKTQARRPKKWFLVEKLRKLIILCYVLITALSREPHIKNTYLHISWCSIFSDGHLELITAKVNKTIGMLLRFQKKITKAVVNDYIQSFPKTTSRLRWRNLWSSWQGNILTETWICINACLAPIGSY